MKKQYIVHVEYSITVDAETCSGAFYEAVYKPPYDKKVRGLVMQIRREIEPIEKPKQLEAQGQQLPQAQQETTAEAYRPLPSV
jgi:hypothetical protein